MRSLAPLALVPALIALSGCLETQGQYPSLLPRPIESQGVKEPARPAPTITPDATLDARIAEIGATLDSAGKAFSAAARDAEAKVAVARGLAAGSSSWLDAQTALSTLGSLRAPITTAVADLERLAIDRGAAGQPPYPALDAAITSANKLADTQEARIGALEAALAGA